MSESSDWLAAEKKTQFLNILIDFAFFTIQCLRIFTVAGNHKMPFLKLLHKISMEHFGTICPAQLPKTMKINYASCTYIFKDTHQRNKCSMIKSKYFSFLIFIPETEITQKMDSFT